MRLHRRKHTSVEWRGPQTRFRLTSATSTQYKDFVIVVKPGQHLSRLACYRLRKRDENDLPVSVVLRVHRFQLSVIIEVINVMIKSSVFTFVRQTNRTAGGTTDTNTWQHRPEYHGRRGGAWASGAHRNPAPRFCHFRLEVWNPVWK